MSYVYPIKVFRKAAVERRRIYLDYHCWLAEDEMLTDVQVTIAPYTVDAPVVVSTGYPDAEHRKLVMFVSGGLGNTSYTLSMVVRTDAGQIKRDDLGVMVTP